MTRYSLGQIAQFTGGKLIGNADLTITDISFDSRNLVSPRSSIFIALKTPRNDGHHYIQSAFDKGVRAFMVHSDFNSDLDASFIKLEDPFSALQRLSKHHRDTFINPVLAITGSNGKTIIKEWLSQVLSKSLNVATTPRSFNSQLGVPLSLLQMGLQHDMAIIEAGISEVGEMEKLEAIISPSIGIFTNAGEAHLQNFTDRKELIIEKAKLFFNTEWLVVNSDQSELVSLLKTLDLPLFTWGESENSDVTISSKTVKNRTEIDFIFEGKPLHFSIPFTDNASVENACHVLIASLKIGVKSNIIQSGISALEPLDMRLQVLKGINNCTLINDAYTADVRALEISLNLANKHSYNRTKTLILSAFQEGRSTTYASIKKLIEEKGVERLITIGLDEKSARFISSSAEVFTSKEDFLDQDINSLFQDEVILIKGARKYKLESITHRLQLKDHQTVLEINMNSFTENLNFYRSVLQPKTKVMAMVKALSYGSGAYEVASHLEGLGVDYLAVAYTDEGIGLRKTGIQLPILVLNPEPSSFESIIRYNLEPEIYSISLLKKFKFELESLNVTEYPIHIKLDTGMHRLGIGTNELDSLIQELTDSDVVKVESIFSHLAASENAEFDDFTHSQIDLFNANSSRITASLKYDTIRHICNTAGISRFPNAHMDMVRLGIGLYGISSDEETQFQLELAGKLKTTIIQTRLIEAGQSLGYGRNFHAKTPTRIAIIPIGYADGLFRGLGNGQFYVKIGNQTAPIIGNICMDMAFVDITSTTAQTGDEVLIFNSSEDINHMAKVMKTIPYEILSSISHRVKRTYFTE